MLGPRFTSPAQVSLLIIAIVSFIVSVVWFVTEPSFEPFLAFLAGIASLIGAFVDTDQLYRNAGTPRQDHEFTQPYERFSEPIRRKPTRAQNSGRNRNLYERVENRLYFDAFAPMKALLPIIAIFSFIVMGILMVMIIAGADGASLSFIGLIWLGSVSTIYTFMIKALYRRINTTGFYDKIESVSGRETVKHSLQKRSWGNMLVDIYMRILIFSLLKTNKREANKFMRQFK